MDHRAICDNGYLASVAQQLRFSNFQFFRIAIERHTDSISARITHRCGPDMLGHREKHVPHFAFVFRRHQNDVWDAAQISDVEQAMMRWPIAAGDAAAIETELHVEILNADVVNHLIERALQKSRVDRADGLQSFARKTGRKSHTML